ncbi:hypothetical protein ILUMI_02948 [Ignelater luminosus]|uniref:Peptidase S1 domain-containing protein n=1 Tax=Ignelater luminosus TaxID=2038154 RepID=A0A8K0DCH4_IGNLU|nr:hypothetical protein ILUMI_02948 [Ignelater luminosus]
MYIDIFSTGIRLGDYNVKNTTDCVDTTGITECSDPLEEFGIEKVIIHPKFVHNYSKNENDIALIRLDRTVTYTDYIRPICLPLHGTKLAEVGDTLLMTGWGNKDDNKPLAEIKKKVQSKLISDEECTNFQLYGRYLTKDHFCTKDIEQNNDFSCKGDTGGPVMYSSNLQWHQEGVISFSASGCGTVNPNVHTK